VAGDIGEGDAVVIGQGDVVGAAGQPQAGRVGRPALGRRALLLGALRGLVVFAAIAVAGVALGLLGHRFGSHALPTIAVGFNPEDVALDPAAHRAYVTGGNTVTVIDTRNNAVATTVRVGLDPIGVALDPAMHRAYVTSGNAVAVIDTSENVLVAAIAMRPSPAGVALDPAAHRAYVAHAFSNSVSVLDTDRNAVVTVAAVGAPNSLGADPGSVAVDSAAHRAYIALLRRQCLGARHGSRRRHRHDPRGCLPDRRGGRPRGPPRLRRELR